MKLRFEPSYVSASSVPVGGVNKARLDVNDENIDLSHKLNQLSLLRAAEAQNDNPTSSSINSQNAELATIYRNSNQKSSANYANFLIFELSEAMGSSSNDLVDKLVENIKLLDAQTRNYIALKFNHLEKRNMHCSLKQLIDANIVQGQDHLKRKPPVTSNNDVVHFASAPDPFTASLKRWVEVDNFIENDLLKWKSMLSGTNSSDKTVLHQVCAYHYVPASKMSLFHTIYNQSFNYSDKIRAIILGLNCSKIDGVIEKDSVGILSHLIHETLKERSSCAENLLLLATSLKTSLKQLFTTCCPELFYMLLLEGGAALRKGDHSDEFSDYFKLFPENSFQVFSKGIVHELSSMVSEKRDAPLDLFFNSAFSLQYFAKHSSLPTFIWILNSTFPLFSTVLERHRQVAYSEINNLLGLLLQESLSSNNNHHLAAIAKIAFDLNIKECIQHNMAAKARFSTLGNIIIFDFLFPSSNTSAPVPNSLLKCCNEIIRDPKHPFKLLALCGLKSLFSSAVANDDAEFLQRVQRSVACSFELVSFYPFCRELQDVLFGTEAGYEDFTLMTFFANSFVKLYSGGNLVDLLLVYLSWLWYRNSNESMTGFIKAYELCHEKLLLMAKEKPSLIVETYTEYWIDSELNASNWGTLLQALEAIQIPNSFSEWVFSVYTKALDYCKPFEKECFQSLLPAALADPMSILPVLPILLVLSSISPNINFMKAVFKSEVIDMFNRSYFDSDSIEAVLRALQSFFIIFTDISSEGTDFPTWRTLFSIDELCVLYAKTLKLNMIELSSFFMQLVWSLDSTKTSSNELYEMFVTAKDYKSALGVFSCTSNFTTERAVYTFMSDRSNNFAEIGLKMLINQGESKLDSVFLHNNALTSDSNTFNMHFNLLSRQNPEKLELYNRVRAESDYNSSSETIDLIPIKKILYESERGAGSKNDYRLEDLTAIAGRRDNAVILTEAKSLRRIKDFENAFHVLSKINLQQDSFWTLKYYLELGNWFYASGKYNTAVQIFNSLSKEQKSSKLLSKIYRKLAVSMNASRHFSDHEIMDAFERAIASDKSCAKACFEMALYQDTRSNKSPDDVTTIIKNFARTLLNSRKFDHLAYPRLITIWLNNTGNEKKTYELMKTFITSAATSQAVNHLSQLISRIGHPNQSSHLLISALLEKIFYDFPDATLWKIGSVVHSANELRKSRATSLLNKVTARDKACDIDVFLQISQLFLEICDMAVPNDVVKVPLSKELRRFKRLLSSGSLIAAPNSTLVYRPEIKEEYDYILSFEDQCVTLPSLQRPKKLRISFNNAKFMNVLLKPKDDLRRDSRFMELCYFLNRNFAKKRLKYDVKTFAVTPLNDECGIIEWVENTAGLRNVLIKTYKKVNISVQRRDMKDIIEMKIDEYEKFTKFLLPRFPPILMHWFFEKFPSLDRWTSAVKDYSHSMAVMSMIGYIMGLGDRHGENILFDEKSGACVHVDFNCLFDKGKTFQFPEKVPFRLTQNLVHAFGAGGVEAKFKPASIAIMDCLWESKRSILTNLEAFLHDPLVEWAKSKNPGRGGAPVYDITNEMATQTLKNVDRKLSGYIENENFSCEGQVEKLIQHATDKKNLSQMYFGWAAFL